MKNRLLCSSDVSFSLCVTDPGARHGAISNPLPLSCCPLSAVTVCKRDKLGRLRRLSGTLVMLTCAGREHLTQQWPSTHQLASKARRRLQRQSSARSRTAPQTFFFSLFFSPPFLLSQRLPDGDVHPPLKLLRVLTSPRQLPAPFHLPFCIFQFLPFGLGFQPRFSLNCYRLKRGWVFSLLHFGCCLQLGSRYRQNCVAR